MKSNKKLEDLLNERGYRYSWLTCHASKYNKDISDENSIRDYPEITTSIGYSSGIFGDPLFIANYLEDPNFANNGRGPRKEHFAALLEEVFKALEEEANSMCHDKERYCDTVEYGIQRLEKVNQKYPGVKLANDYIKGHKKYGKLHRLDCKKVRKK